jgi:hypothetical protein
VLDGQTLGEFYTLWMGGGARRATHSAGQLREQLNRKRAKLGLPPMKPAPKKG